MVICVIRSLYQIFSGISRMSQHGYMRHTATPPLVLDLIRLSQSASCGKTINFTLLILGINRLMSNGARNIFWAQIPQILNPAMILTLIPRINFQLSTIRVLQTNKQTNKQPYIQTRPNVLPQQLSRLVKSEFQQMHDLCVPKQINTTQSILPLHQTVIFPFSK